MWQTLIRLTHWRGFRWHSDEQRLVDHVTQGGGAGGPAPEMSRYSDLSSGRGEDVGPKLDLNDALYVGKWTTPSK